MDRIGTPYGVVSEYMARPCTACGGKGGSTVTEVDSAGTLRQSWKPCRACSGAGVR